MNRIKTILISQFALPYKGMGSWTTMYNYYLTQFDNNIDIIIGPKSDLKINSVDYFSTEENFVEKLTKKVLKRKYLKVFKILDKVINENEKYLIHIIDNHGLVLNLDNYLNKKKIRSNFKIQFFYHGFPPFLGNFESRSFFNSIDEYVVLTHDSYLAHKNLYTNLSCAFRVLHNGVDESKFYNLSATEKLILRKKENVEEEKIIFLWCSKDFPKKGLDFILKAWTQVIYERKELELWIIGSEREFNLQNVKNLGEISNVDLPKYYQMADFYLFPTLCHEGFGLTLIEALKCGCYPIASEIGGVPEVLNYGKLGKLVADPHILRNWIMTIEESIEFYINNNRINPYEKFLTSDLYSLALWSKNMNQLILESKTSFL